MKTLKNWYLYPIVYFKLTKKPFVFFKTKTGLKLKIRTLPSTDIHVFTEIWLMNEYLKHGIKIKKEDIVIDIGSHIGLFSTLASHFCEKGKIICYEPNKENYKLLLENKQNNNLENVKINNLAVSSKSGYVKLFLHDKDFSSHGLHKQSDSWVNVKAITLKEIFENNNITKCDFLKMDCEGTEYEILMNLDDTCLKKIEKICFEFHNIENNPFSINDVIKKLNLNGFLVRKTSNNGNGMVYAIQKTNL